ncbi:MAG: FMN-binding protein [Syntrophomonadaceae bacterium]|jgi:Na+-translocating ferredoxin:NAD+ oxidoreductase RnfG subunit|nr:FMN-binding protein [Syntrophomonadaceae bacterium]
MLFRKIALVLGLSLIFLTGCAGTSQPNEAELRAFNKILAQDYSREDYGVITREVMNGEREKKFKAVQKVFATPSGDYAFITCPVGYNGPIELAVVIDGKSHTTLGMRIVEHMESEDYVRDMHNSWFTDRFKGKSIARYLEQVHLEAQRDNEIIIITGATVSTEAIVNGVNACLGVLQEYEWGKTAPAVSYMVKFEKAEGDGPQENGTLAIRAYGSILGEITLDEIRQLPRVKRTMSIHSSTGTTTHQFTGTLLAHAISLLDPDLLTQYSQVMPVGVDDYISNISMEEVLAENSVFLMYEDNGQPLLTKEGQAGAMRVVVIDDVFGQRFTNYMIEIVLE